MSASTERLVENIKLVEQAIIAARVAGSPTLELEADLKRLQRKLAVCNEALTEGKQLLKS